MKWWLWVLIVVVVVAVTATSSAALARMTRSTAAKKRGLSNTPDTEDDKRRLVWLDQRRAEVEAVLREKFPGVTMTSAYRNNAVNAAVDGEPTSLHRHALAFDEGDGSPSYTEHAKHLRDNTHRLSVQPRTVIAEANPPHLHIDYTDPLGKIHKTATATTWLMERPGRKRGESRTNYLTNLG